MTQYLGANSGDEAHSCHICAANGFDFLYVFVALLIHELQDTHPLRNIELQHKKDVISVKKKRKSCSVPRQSQQWSH